MFHIFYKTSWLKGNKGVGVFQRLNLDNATLEKLYGECPSFLYAFRKNPYPALRAIEGPLSFAALSELFESVGFDELIDLIFDKITEGEETNEVYDKVFNTIQYGY